MYNSSVSLVFTFPPHPPPFLSISLFLSLVIDLLDVVRPFCDIVINEETTGPVTGQAIFALDKFLSSGLFGKSI